MKALFPMLLAAALATPLAAQEPPQLVKLITVGDVITGTTRQFFGQVAARHTVDLAFQVSGQIRQLPVIEGEPIAKGDLIAQLDLRPFELALDQARLQKDQADRNLERLEKLRGTTVSQVTIDDAETAASVAQIALENAQISLDDATLHAPFDGLVAARLLDNFTTIASGTPVVRLHDMSDIRIEIDVPEVLVQRASKSDEVELTAEFPSSDTRYPLQTRELQAETSAVGQTYRLTLGMEPPEGFEILPGSSATVRASVRREETGTEIPPASVAIAPDGSTTVFVFVPGEGDTGTLSERPVTATPTDTGAVAVEELKPGEEIVAAGTARLSDGQTVRRFTGFPN